MRVTPERVSVVDRAGEVRKNVMSMWLEEDDW
jgi:hypothetical protein